MDQANARALLTFFETEVQPARFNMGSWWGDPGTDRGTCMVKEMGEFAECGTVGCIAGWTAKFVRDTTTPEERRRILKNWRRRQGNVSPDDYGTIAELAAAWLDLPWKMTGAGHDLFSPIVAQDMLGRPARLEDAIVQLRRMLHDHPAWVGTGLFPEHEVAAPA